MSDIFRIDPPIANGRAIVIGQLPEAVQHLLERQGYWPLHLDCTGEPDPGRVTVWCPGELLEQLPELLNSAGRAALESHSDWQLPHVEIDRASLERAVAEWRKWRSSAERARVDVWYCADCDEEWQRPSIPHDPKCPRCGAGGWWRRFL